MPTIRIRVPATSANLGPGFDCLGLAVGIYNELTCEWGETVTETSALVQGEGAGELRRDNDAMLNAFEDGLRTLGHAATALRVVQKNAIPLARGLGSSAAAIVGGLTAALAVAGRELERGWLLARAILIEPHADNIAAAIYGGLTAALLRDDGSPRCLQLPVASGLHLAYAVPSFHISTQDARSVLPQQYGRDDAVFSSARAAILVGALMCGAHDWLAEAVRDRIHTPARARLIAGWDEVQTRGYDAGAAGVFISGSGPTVGAFVRGETADAERVARAMSDAFARHNVSAQAYWPAMDACGVRLEHSPA